MSAYGNKSQNPINTFGNKSNHYHSILGRKYGPLKGNNLHLQKHHEHEQTHVIPHDQGGGFSMHHRYQDLTHPHHRSNALYNSGHGHKHHNEMKQKNSLEKHRREGKDERHQNFM